MSDGSPGGDPLGGSPSANGAVPTASAFDWKACAGMAHMPGPKGAGLTPEAALSWRKGGLPASGAPVGEGPGV